MAIATALMATLLPKDVAKRLRVSPDKVVSWIKDSTLKGFNVGNGPLRPRYRIDPTDLTAFENSRQVTAVVSAPRRKRRQAQTSKTKEYF